MDDRLSIFAGLGPPTAPHAGTGGLGAVDLEPRPLPTNGTFTALLKGFRCSGPRRDGDTAALQKNPVEFHLSVLPSLPLSRHNYMQQTTSNGKQSSHKSSSSSVDSPSSSTRSSLRAPPISRRTSRHGHAAYNSSPLMTQRTVHEDRVLGRREVP
jgi:hypothetical protein